MTMTVDEILEHVRALPERDRLRLVERVVHDVVATAPPATASWPERSDAIWADAPEAEFEAFLRSVTDGRDEPWRSTG